MALDRYGSHGYISAQEYAEASSRPSTYQNIYVGGPGPTQLGNSYHQGPSEEERNLHAILESLRYEGMNDRGESLGEPGSGSYEWIFDSQNPHPAHFDIPTCQTRQEFLESRWRDESRAAGVSLKAWLGSGTQPLFWITGKPGSGKSILMKFLRYHWQTEDLLKAQGGSLIMAQHFFWIPGSTIQRTFTGMLRHLAHSVVETLWSQQSLEPSLFGRYWGSRPTSCHWTNRELIRLISRLAALPNVRMFFVVDSLDECWPQDRLEEVAAGFLELCRIPNVRICASSRPWHQFTSAFYGLPSMCIDILTRPDMLEYAKSELQSAGANFKRKRGFEADSIELVDIARAVVSGADGVFLWADRVLSALRSELRKGGRTANLRRILEKFPGDLETFYRQLIYDRIDTRGGNVSDTASALKLAVQTAVIRERIAQRLPDTCFDDEGGYLGNTVVSYWLLMEGRLSRDTKLSDIGPRRITDEAEKDMCDRTQAYLGECCKDLLFCPIRPPKILSPVEFVHRTVLEFLQTSVLRETINSHGSPVLDDEEFLEFNLNSLCALAAMRSDQDCFDAQYTLQTVIAGIAGMPYVPPNPIFWAQFQTFMTSRLRSKCFCLGEDHGTVLLCCIGFGLAEHATAVLERWPHLAIQGHHFTGVFMGEVIIHCNPLALALGLDQHYQISIEPDIRMIRSLLECGCDPNGNAFIPHREGRVGTVWEMFLGTVLSSVRKQSHQTSRREPSDWRCPDDLLHVLTVMLEHGASVHCIPPLDRNCPQLTGSKSSYSSCDCARWAEALQSCIPAGQHAGFSRLTEGRMLAAARRKQILRAVRALFISIHNSFATDASPGLILEVLICSFLNGFVPELSFFNMCCHCRGRDDSAHGISSVICAECVGHPSMCTSCITKHSGSSAAHDGHLCIRIIEPSMVKRSENDYLVSFWYIYDWYQANATAYDMPSAQSVLGEAATAWLETRPRPLDYDSWVSYITTGGRVDDATDLGG